MLPSEEAIKSRTGARIRAWCIICFALGVLFTNYPILQIFNQPSSLGGIPLTVVYLLGIWLLGIAVLFILSRALAGSSDQD